MRYRVSLVLLFVAPFSGCVTTYTLATAGVHQIGQINVTAGPGWNIAPSTLTPNARQTSRTWTQDGLLLDRLMFIPGVNDGEPIIRSRDKTAALPVFRADMLPNELEELVESTIVKLYGEGNTAVSTENLRPHDFGRHSGVMFDINAAVTESPDYRGIVGAFIVDEQLYVILFLGAEPHYFEKHRETVEAIMESVTMQVPT